MDQNIALVIAFGAAAVSAAIAAFREDIFPKVQKTALAVCFAAIGFLIALTTFLGK